MWVESGSLQPYNKIRCKVQQSSNEENFEVPQLPDFGEILQRDVFDSIILQDLIQVEVE